ncbi:hypothetical protein [Variovorax sp. PAMC 28711]|uniref:hypothetical protein n=1 Tax=Variovorax sp. PAMC 28711 TaxID=1795631 RepID=UPI00078B215F|nr:hypothetical protein [Variovorax sp. PAMC 28711]AMM24566.1 hypothetical protein AX767_09555 [Variovorax sp. PAMC 28711]
MAEQRQRRYKHTGSAVPDFSFTECYDCESRTLTISAQDFDSVAIGDLVIHNDYGVVAHEDELGPFVHPSASVIVEIASARFSARIVRQRRYGLEREEQVTVRLSML